MSLDFSTQRWQKTIDNYERWWNGTLGRPLIQTTLGGRKTDLTAPNTPYYGFTAFYDLSVPAQDIARVWEYELSKTRFVGDSFPAIWPNFGAGVIAAFLGCRLENSPESETVWFHAPAKRELADIRFIKDDANVWYRRVCDIMRAAGERFGSMLQIGMTDLGGNLDILSSFRPGEDLLLDLYDDPDSVKARTWEAHDLWFRYFDEMNAILQPTVRNPGYTCWTALLSQKPFYMLQCDFCYMIGPDMFDEFVKPELAAVCKRIDRAFYHLDGAGELPHLDSLLSIPELKGVQWQPGAGAKPTKLWPEVYRKIHAAGKKIQLYGDLEAIDVIADAIGSADSIYFTPNYTDDENAVRRTLERYGVPFEAGT